MGNKSTKENLTISEDDIQNLVKKTNFTKDEIVAMHENFIKNFPKGVIDKKSFVEFFQNMRPEKDVKEFCSQLFKAFDIDKSGKIDFNEFVTTIALTSDQDVKQKLRVAFRMFDSNNNGKLSLKEIENVIVGINKFYGEKLNDAGVKPIEMAKLLLQKYDKDHSDFLTEDEFLNGIADPTIRAFEFFPILRDGVF